VRLGISITLAGLCEPKGVDLNSLSMALRMLNAGRRARSRRSIWRTLLVNVDSMTHNPPGKHVPTVSFGKAFA
jgi:hypothetical protein